MQSIKAGLGKAWRGVTGHGLARADSAFSRFTEAVERCKSIMWHGLARHAGARNGLARAATTALSRFDEAAQR